MTLAISGEYMFNVKHIPVLIRHD